MTMIEFSKAIDLLKSLWGSWKPSDDLKAVFFEAFGQYEENDILTAIRRYRMLSRYNEPKIPDLQEVLNKVIAENKAAERNQGPKEVWPGQVFVVVVHNQRGETEQLFDFHIPNPVARVPDEFAHIRMDQHIETVKRDRGNRFPGCHFSGEILTDSQWNERKYSHGNYWRTNATQFARAADG